MARSMIAGMTDYSVQSFEEIVKDLNDLKRFCIETNSSVEQEINNPKFATYWNTLPPDFLTEINLLRELFTDVISEIDSVLEEVQAKHADIFIKFGDRADEGNKAIGQIWHSDSWRGKKDYGNDNFATVELIYQQSRDMVVSLIDLGNMGSSLNNFIGKQFKKETYASYNIRTQYNQFSIKDTLIDPAFNVDIIANEFATQLKSFEEETGQIVGVLGEWGRGKTYFFKKVCEKLNLPYDTSKCEKVLKSNLITKSRFSAPKLFFSRKDKEASDFLLVKFHAWKYQKTPAVWAHLFQAFIDAYLDVSWLKKYYRIFLLNIERTGNWNTWGFSICLIVFAVLWYLFIPIDTKIDILSSIIKSFGGIIASIFLILKICNFIRFAKIPLKQVLSSFTDCPSYEHLLGFQSEIHKEFKALLKVWIHKGDKRRIMLFVDDVDRCSQENMIDLVDALRVMLEDPEIISRMLVVLAIDEKKLGYAINKKYPDVNKDSSKRKLEIEYMDKLFLFCLKLPMLTNVQRLEFFENLVAKEGGVSEEIGNINNSTSTSTSDVDTNASVGEPKNNDSSEETEEGTSEKEYKKMSSYEFEYFKAKLEEANELSPRSIRIIFYRYLFARNLWLKLYNEEFPYNEILNSLFGITGPYHSKITNITSMVKAY